jgi:hypothetical protein
MSFQTIQPQSISQSPVDSFWVCARAILIQTDEYLHQGPNLRVELLRSATERLAQLQTSLNTLRGTVPLAILETWTTEVERLTLATDTISASLPEAATGFGLRIDCHLEYSTEDTGSRRRGRPTTVIDTAQVLEALSMGYTARDIARSSSDFSESTLNRRIKSARLRAKDNLPDHQLDQYVYEALQEAPNSGYRAVCSRLRAAHIVVTERAVQASIHRVDPSRISIQAVRALPRRIKYWVPSPNSVWHFDGNHKLNRWGFVTHGCVDGYSRRLMWLEVKTDNYASSVLGKHSQVVDIPLQTHF